MNLHQQIHAQVLQQLSQAVPNETALNDALRLLSKWRSVLLQNTLLQQQGTVVMSGPLQGLDFLPQSTEGCHVPKLLGCYEQPLLPYIEAAIQAGYPLIVNIGCAEGYKTKGTLLTNARRSNKLLK